MQFGKVKFFNREKAFGFIICENGDPDVFVHKDGTQPGTILTENLRVKFDTETTPRGLRAINVEAA